MASEQLFGRRQYLRFKWCLVTTYALFMLLMIFSMASMIMLIEGKFLKADQLCIDWHYMSMRWGMLICPIIFLVFTVIVQIKVEDEFKRQIMKVNLDEILYKEN